MIIDSRSGLRGLLVNADTSQPIRWARRANLETGEYEAFAADPDAARRAGLPVPPVLRGVARLRWVPAAPLYRPRPSRPGDVEPLAEARRRLGVVAIPPADGVECEAKGCHRLAEYVTADEQEVEPVVGGQGLACERAVAVRRHQYCAWHYRLPVSTSLRGVEREVSEVTVRPQ